MNNKVKFLRGTSSEYAVAEKDSDTIYFTTDDGKLYIGDKEVSGDGGLTIDDTLSDTSTNPVQNKTVKAELDKKADITDIPTTLPANGGTADTAHQVIGSSSKVRLYEDGEGGNLRLVSPDGNHSMEMDLFNNEQFRMYFQDENGIVVPLNYNFTTKKLNINGDASTVNGHSVNADVPANAVFTDTVPDLSAYAKTTDVPNIKVNSAVNADTLGGKSIKDLAYINDIICGLKNGWAYNTVGTVLTYGDRYVIKTTADLSYIGWFVNGEGWFQPLIVSQYPSGTNYTMYGQECGYAIGNGTMFDYKGRTYYACWGTFGSYQNPNVTGGFQLTVENEDYITACKTLIDNCERIEAFYAKNAGIAHEVNSPNGKALLYEDGEGGNFELTAPDGSHFMEMDLYNNTNFRMYFGDGTSLYFPFEFDFDSKKISINGENPYSPSNKPYVTGEEGCGYIVTASVKDYQIFNFTPSAVICQIADGSAFFATIIQNGFRVSLFPNASEKILKYIAFK